MSCHCALVRVGCEAKWFTLKSDWLFLEFKGSCIEGIGFILRTPSEGTRTLAISTENKDLFMTNDCDEGVTKCQSLRTNLIPCSRERFD